MQLWLEASLSQECATVIRVVEHERQFRAAEHYSIAAALRYASCARKQSVTVQAKP